jgi:hypothetical protein
VTDLGATLTSSDPEPPVGTIVCDAFNRAWRRWPEGYWLEERSPVDPDGDPGSWVKVAGNYGPVTVIAQGW